MEDDEVLARSPVAEVAAADCPFDMEDGGGLVIDEGDEDDDDVRDPLFSPVIVSTCSLNDKREEEGGMSSLEEEERPRLQSDESSRVRDCYKVTILVGKLVGLTRIWNFPL